ncbi:MAG: acyltransferase family protein [Myxococcales bacterium]|nr:acyltransferase family protein [Myxococcales bacterium]
MLIGSEVQERLGRLTLDFNQYGLDPFGVSREHLGLFYSFLGTIYKTYFRCRTYGIEHVPEEGRFITIGNHSGSLPVDGGMLLASMFFEREPPVHLHGMVEKFAQHWPFVSPWFNRVGQFTGLPEHAVNLLEADRALMVFPEGARGTGKLYKDRYTLVRFGTGFMRIALKTRSPILPFAFIGGEEALPAVYHAKTVAKLFGAPYWPVPPYLIPFPKPTPTAIHYGKPLFFEGTGNEKDEVIQDYVDQVRRSVADLIIEGRKKRGDSDIWDPITREAVSQ